MKQLTFVINELEKEKEKLIKDNVRLLKQIETCDQMINFYNEKIKENDEKIKSIEYILLML